ncbi:MAG: GNAT family N-acetyltransferase [Devosia sp.]
MSEIGSLHVTDAADAMRLSVEAGWNQTLEDWQTLLGNGFGFAIRNETGGIIATSVATPYSIHFGWIGMVLVDSRFRRRGLASLLMQRAMDWLVDDGLVPMLDATPAGRPVYERLGFVAVEGITRWRRPGTLRPAVPETATNEVFDIAEVDLAAFGADRIAILSGLATRRGSLIMRHVTGAGFALIRRGRTAMHVGPIVVTEPELAETILMDAIDAAGESAIIDVPDRAAWARHILQRRGFSVERPLTRMALGRNTPFGRPEMIVAIAGPEIG